MQAAHSDEGPVASYLHPEPRSLFLWVLSLALDIMRSQIKMPSVEQAALSISATLWVRVS